MIYRMLMKYVLTNEKVLKRIADSPIVKVAGQISAYILHRGKEVGRKKIKNIHKSIEQKAPDSSKLKKPKVKPAHILKNFSEAFNEQWKQEEVKRQQKKLAKKAKKAAKKLQE